MTFVAALASLSTRVKVVVGLAIAVSALLVAGVPLSTFLPFAGVAGCLGMHLFMNHGHGDHHAATDLPSRAAGASEGEEAFGVAAHVSTSRRESAETGSLSR